MFFGGCIWHKMQAIKAFPNKTGTALVNKGATETS